MLGERGWIGFGGELAVPRHEPGTEVGCADSLEVHGKKAHVSEHIAVAELVVELDAVEDARTVIEAEDVVGEQVAVAVDHFAVGDPMFEEGCPAVEVATRELLHALLDLRVQHGAHVRLHRLERGLPLRPHRVDAAGPLDLECPLGS